MNRSSNLDYLYNKPKVIIWKRIVGPELDYCQMHDVVYDEYDYRTRQLKYSQILNGGLSLKGL